MTEWNENISVMITKLEDGAIWDETNSGVYHEETFWYNPKTDDGDVAGRVPVKPGVTWKMLMLNYDSEAEEGVMVEYGAATYGLVATTLGLIATGLALIY